MAYVLTDRMTVQGYQIKVFAILLSSFREVLFLDADNHPAADPSVAFTFKQYKATGAVFWPDKCIAHTSILAFWDVMGLPRPSAWLTDMEEPPIWTVECNPNHPFEFETGQIVVDKKRVWAALMLTAFLNKNHKHILGRFLYGEKQSFAFAFNATGTAYGLSPHHHFSVCRSGQETSGANVACCTTLAQRHPDTGDVLFLHRSSVKFSWAHQYVMHSDAPYRMWTDLAVQGAHSPYGVAWPKKHLHLPRAVFLPGVEHPCLVPLGNDLRIIPLDPKVPRRQ